MNHASAKIGTLPACLDSCCSKVNEKPFHPTDHVIKRTSKKQTTGEGKVRTCPSSIFAKYEWVTYCMTKGTIACFFCKEAKQHGLITFSNNGEEAFGEFSNWKKCHEKLIKHSQSNSTWKPPKKCCVLTTLKAILLQLDQ